MQNIQVQCNHYKETMLGSLWLEQHWHSKLGPDLSKLPKMILRLYKFFLTLLLVYQKFRT